MIIVIRGGGEEEEEGKRREEEGKRKRGGGAKTKSRNHKDVAEKKQVTRIFHLSGPRVAPVILYVKFLIVWHVLKISFVQVRSAANVFCASEKCCKPHIYSLQEVEMSSKWSGSGMHNGRGELNRTLSWAG